MIADYFWYVGLKRNNLEAVFVDGGIRNGGKWTQRDNMQIEIGFENLLILKVRL